MSWETETAIHRELRSSIESLLESLLRDAGIPFHSVSSRVKDEVSAHKKVEASPDKYTTPKDLTDLLGVRIIAYFDEDVDRIAGLFVGEFEIDRQNSVDKRGVLEADQFGYLSMHYVASLSEGRTKLVEYKKFKGAVFELQIRSVLQHAWAEIEHDLGYKVDAAIPREMRRRFSRLAGLLEIADNEFTKLRTDLEDYKEKAEVAVTQRSTDLEVDQATLSALVEKDKSLHKLDTAIAAAWPAPLSAETNPRFIAARSQQLAAVGLVTIDDLRKELSARGEALLRFVPLWRGVVSDVATRTMPLNRGVILFYLYLSLVAEAPDELANSLERLSEHPEVVQGLRNTWREAQEPGSGPSTD